jgi:hypothetical protein
MSIVRPQLSDTKSAQQLTDLVSTVVSSDFLSDDENGLVPVHLLCHCRVEGITDGLRVGESDGYEKG